ncbi:MAG: hypothetical protein DWP95_11445 [Proteobacteria bacterium]|nr:MAG: hypothetical protein DWP95_11445 [Pseudomonadota bacterium]
MIKTTKKKKLSALFQHVMDRLVTVVLLWAVAPMAMAANKGDIPAAITVWITGTVLAVLISLVFSFKKNAAGSFVGIKKAKFFLLLSILLLIVFVAGTAAFFIFM